MVNAKELLLKTMSALFLLTMTSQAGAVSLLFTPPPILTIDGMSVSAADITVLNYAGYMGSTPTVSSVPPVTTAITVGSATPVEIFNDPSLDRTKIYRFDLEISATNPMLSPLNVTYFHAVPDVPLIMPSMSGISYTQIMPSSGPKLVYDASVVDVVDMMPASGTWVDIDPGNGPFVVLDPINVLTPIPLTSPLLGEHGVISTPMPVPAGMALIGLPLITFAVQRYRAKPSAA